MEPRVNMYFQIKVQTKEVEWELEHLQKFWSTQDWLHELWYRNPWNFTLHLASTICFNIAVDHAIA